PKIKQRIPADPRNQAWSNDKTKYGYKMLSKMGWSPGKGLGMNENGSQECIKLSNKLDNLGIGASKKTIDNWLDNSNAFNELLKGLNQQTQDNVDNIAENISEITNESKITNESNCNNVNSECTSIRLAHRAKYLKSKKAAVQDSERLKEILGVKTKSNVTKIESIYDFKNSFNQDDSESVVNNPNNSNKNEKDHFSDVNCFQTIVNKLNTQDYFSLKAKKKNLIETKYFENESDDERPCFNMDDLNLDNKSSIYTKEGKERKPGVNLNCDSGSNNYCKSTVNSLEVKRKRKSKEHTVSRKLKKKKSLRK
ncbi:6814_t:CDS:2, partial [Racocetra persica]